MTVRSSRNICLAAVFEFSFRSARRAENAVENPVDRRNTLETANNILEAADDADTRRSDLQFNNKNSLFFT